MRIDLRKHSYPGRLIVFEGTDGAGKTTMLNMAVDYLRGVIGPERVLLTKQPTDMSRNTKLFQKMMYCKNHEDIDYRAVQLLTMSDRVQHVTEQIEPALKDGKLVLCDRYIYTSLANMLARGYRDEKWFFLAARNLIKPDITFLAYVNPDLAISRIKARPDECRRHLDEELLRNVAAEFLKLKKKAEFRVLNTGVHADLPFSIVKSELEKAVSV